MENNFGSIIGKTVKYRYDYNSRDTTGIIVDKVQCVKSVKEEVASGVGGIINVDSKVVIDYYIICSDGGDVIDIIECRNIRSIIV